VPAPAELASEAPQQGVAFEWVTAAGRHAGTVVHEELERLARVGLPAGHPVACAVGVANVRLLRELGLPEERLSDTLERVRLALAGTLADARGRWLFDPAHRDAASEYALTAVLGGRVVVVTLARTFIDARGTRWIVDFKTSRHEGTDLEGFLNTERSRYAAQLEKYAAVMQLAEPGRPIRLGLYFPLHAGWREWAPGELPPAAVRTSP
jgi:hypothetical protein